MDEIRYCDEIEKYLQDYTPSRIYLNNGINSDSRLKSIIPTFEFLRNYPLDLEFLYPTLAELRTVKDQKEIEIMQFIGKITAEAHIRVMKNVKPGLKEY